MKGASILLSVAAVLCMYGRLVSSQGTCPGMGAPLPSSYITINNVSAGPVNALSCGNWPDPWTEDFAAVASKCWTTQNPNNDPMCKMCAKVTGSTGTTLELPILDKCPKCDASAALKLGGSMMCCTTNVDGKPTQSQFCPTREKGKYKV